MSLTLKDFMNPANRLFIDNQDQVWELIGVVTDPQVIIRNLKTGKQIHEVIGCRNFEGRELEHLSRAKPSTP